MKTLPGCSSFFLRGKSLHCLPPDGISGDTMCGQHDTLAWYVELVGNSMLAQKDILSVER